MSKDFYQEYSSNTTSEGNNGEIVDPPGVDLQMMNQPRDLQQEFSERANTIIKRFQRSYDIKNQSLLEMIKNLSTVLIATSRIGRKEDELAETEKVVFACLKEMRLKLVSKQNEPILNKTVEETYLRMRNILMQSEQKKKEKTKEMNVDQDDYCQQQQDFEITEEMPDETTDEII